VLPVEMSEFLEAVLEADCAFGISKRSVGELCPFTPRDSPCRVHEVLNLAIKFVQSDVITHAFRADLQTFSKEILRRRVQRAPARFSKRFNRNKTRLEEQVELAGRDAVGDGGFLRNVGKVLGGGGTFLRRRRRSGSGMQDKEPFPIALRVLSLS
jgi:hypothetical protein